MNWENVLEVLEADMIDSLIVLVVALVVENLKPIYRKIKKNKGKVAVGVCAVFCIPSFVYFICLNLNLSVKPSWLSFIALAGVVLVGIGMLINAYNTRENNEDNWLGLVLDFGSALIILLTGLTQISYLAMIKQGTSIEHISLLAIMFGWTLIICLCIGVWNERLRFKEYKIYKKIWDVFLLLLIVLFLLYLVFFSYKGVYGWLQSLGHWLGSKGY